MSFGGGDEAVGELMGDWGTSPHPIPGALWRPKLPVCHGLPEGASVSPPRPGSQHLCAASRGISCL